MFAPSGLVALVMLPIGVRIAFIAVRALGINSNITTLGCIALAGRHGRKVVPAR
jgi:Cu(I)/Ag(I) efflux system membrane protein CusA/SilA